MNNTRKCIKGIYSTPQCRESQYEEGKTYTIAENELSISNKGFHAIDENECPLYVFDCCAPSIIGVPARYFEVEIGGATLKNAEITRGSEMKIGAEIGILGLVKAHVEWVKKHIKKEGKKHDTEDYSSASNTGDQSSTSNSGDFSSASNSGSQSSASNSGDFSSASNSGDQSSASNTGDHSAALNTGRRSSASNTGNESSASNTGEDSSASNTGNKSSASNTGDHSSASNTGNQSSASNAGYRSSATNTGDLSSASNTGNQSSASNTGDYSYAEVSGKESVAAVFGEGGKARGALGCWLVLTERGELDYYRLVHPIIGMKAVKVDGKEIKPDTWYELKDGKVVEAEF